MKVEWKKIINWKSELAVKILLYLTIGITSIILAYRIQDEFERSNLLNLANTAVVSINEEEIVGLSKDKSDLNKQAYKNLRQKLIRIKNANVDNRFVYLMGLNQKNEVIFLVDAEDFYSNDFSPPGSQYKEASENNKNLFKHGVGFTEGPMLDKWGIWVSALAPVRSKEGKIIAILGIDVNAKSWQQRVIYSMLTPILLLVILLFLTFFFVYRQTHKSKIYEFENKYLEAKKISAEIALRLENQNVNNMQKIAESEKKYRGIFDNSIVGIYQTTPEGRYLELNNAFARMLGYDNPETLKKEINDIGKQLYVDPDQRKELVELLRRDKEVKNFEIELRRTDNKIIWLAINAQHAIHEGKEVLDGTCIDITEKKLEEAKQKKAMELLIRSNKMEALGTLAGGIAHDFNNILTAIIGNASLIKEVDEINNAKMFADKILISAKRAGDIIKQILTFSRRMVNKKEPVGVVESLTEAISMCKINKPSNINLVFKPLDGKMEEKYVMAERSSLVQIFLNLIKNAIQSIPEIGGKVLIAIDEVEGHEVTRSGKTGKVYEKWLKVTVKDDGVGISRLDQDFIFDPYFTTKQNKDGTGLGLSIVHRLVTDIDGKISVQSMTGKGTTFEIFLPVNGTGKFDNKKDENHVNFDCRMVFIDDDEMILETYRKLLENDKNNRYKVFIFSDPVEAINFIKDNENEVDIVFSDLTMPDRIDGVVCAREIMKIKNVPVIIMTGHGEKNEVKEAIKEKIIAGMLDKPFGKKDIEQMIKFVKNRII